MIMTWEPASRRSGGAATHHQGAPLVHRGGPLFRPRFLEFTHSSGVTQQRVRIYRASFPTVSSTRAMSFGDHEGHTEEQMTMNTIRTKLSAAICVLFGSAAVGAPWTSAQADEQPPPSKTIKYADLNLQTVEGARVLYNRIRLAATQVCETNDRDPIMRDARPKCVDTAIDNAVKKVNEPSLTALRFGNSGDVRLASK
jgi:UrcA family protein